MNGQPYDPGPPLITASGGLDMTVKGRPVALAAQTNGDLVLVIEPGTTGLHSVVVTDGRGPRSIPDGMPCVDAACGKDGRAMLLYALKLDDET